MTQPKANLRNLRIIELSGVDRPCHAPATVALMKRAVDKEPTMIAKQSAMTSAVEGHQHLIYMVDESQSGTTSYESSYVEGQPRNEYTGHCHPWIRNADGSITIGESLGHSHNLGELSASLAKTVSPTKNPVVAKSDDSKSTRPAVKPHNGDTMKTIVLTEAQHAHYSKLSGDDAEAFLAKSFAERDSVLADIAKADPVVYKTASGIEVRKSHGDIALMLAKQADENASQVAKATEIANVEKAAREATELKKRAQETMSNLAGSDDVHCAILKAVESIADEKLRGEAIQAIKAANDAAKSRSVAKGVNGGEEPTDDSPTAELDTLTMKYAADHKVDRPTARVEVLKTAEGKRLYAKSVGRA